MLYKLYNIYYKYYNVRRKWFYIWRNGNVCVYKQNLTVSCSMLSFYGDAFINLFWKKTHIKNYTLNDSSMCYYNILHFIYYNNIIIFMLFWLAVVSSR